MHRDHITLDRLTELACWIAAGHHRPGERAELAALLLRAEAADLAAERDIPTGARYDLVTGLRSLADALDVTEPGAKPQGLIARMAEERREAAEGLLRAEAEGWLPSAPLTVGGWPSAHELEVARG